MTITASFNINFVWMFRYLTLSTTSLQSRRLIHNWGANWDVPLSRSTAEVFFAKGTKHLMWIVLGMSQEPGAYRLSWRWLNIDCCSENTCVIWRIITFLRSLYESSFMFLDCPCLTWLRTVDRHLRLVRPLKTLIYLWINHYIPFKLLRAVYFLSTYLQ